MRFLVILGFVSLGASWRLKALLLWNPDTANWTGCFLWIGIWVSAIALCALLFKAYQARTTSCRRSHYLAAARPPWCSRLLLFVNDQGRELGVSLMSEKNG
jgi:hypothetical protein